MIPGGANLSASLANGDLAARRFKLMLGLFLAILAGALFIYQRDGLLSDPDSWWHIKAGSDILSSGHFPVTDSYSHSFLGKPWIAKEWLSQIILFLAYAAGGWNGVVILAALAISAAFFATYFSLASELRPHLAAAIAVIAMFLSSTTFLARPHLLTLALAVVWTAGLFRAADKLKPPHFGFLALITLWANLHGSFTLGLAIAGFAMLHVFEQVRLKNMSLTIKWGAFVLLSPLVTLVHPYTYEPFMISIEMARGNEAAQFISEWQPFNPNDNWILEAGLLAALLAVMMLRLRLSWSKAAFVLFALHMFLVHARFGYVFFLLVPVALAAEISRQYPAVSLAVWKTQSRDWLERFAAQRFVPAASVLAAAVLIGAGLFAVLTPVTPPQKSAPVDAIAYVKSHAISGNVFNSYNFGGALIFHGIKTFIDGRAEQLFLDGFNTEVMKTLQSGGEALFEQQLLKYHIDWTLLEPTDPRIGFLDKMPGWQRAYADEFAVVHVRKLPGS
ncbi:MAG: hypothetical protein ACT4SY_01155 [Hyphomicrobiales bacterium]